MNLRTMVNYCIVPGCHGTTGFSVPKTSPLRQLWISVLGLKRDPHKSAIVCDFHFKPTDIRDKNMDGLPSQRRFLKQGTIPSNRHPGPHPPKPKPRVSDQVRRMNNIRPHQNRASKPRVEHDSDENGEDDILLLESSALQYSSTNGPSAAGTSSLRSIRKQPPTQKTLVGQNYPSLTISKTSLLKPPSSNSSSGSLLKFNSSIRFPAAANKQSMLKLQASKVQAQARVQNGPRSPFISRSPSSNQVHHQSQFRAGHRPQSKSSNSNQSQAHFRAPGGPNTPSLIKSPAFNPPRFPLKPTRGQLLMKSPDTNPPRFPLKSGQGPRFPSQSFQGPRFSPLSGQQRSGFLSNFQRFPLKTAHPASYQLPNLPPAVYRPSLTSIFNAARPRSPQIPSRTVQLPSQRLSIQVPLEAKKITLRATRIGPFVIVNKKEPKMVLKRVDLAREKRKLRHNANIRRCRYRKKMREQQERQLRLQQYQNQKILECLAAAEEEEEVDEPDDGMSHLLVPEVYFEETGRPFVLEEKGAETSKPSAFDPLSVLPDLTSSVDLMASTDTTTTSQPSVLQQLLISDTTSLDGGQIDLAQCPYCGPGHIYKSDFLPQHINDEHKAEAATSSDQETEATKS